MLLKKLRLTDLLLEHAFVTSANPLRFCDCVQQRIKFTNKYTRGII